MEIAGVVCLNTGVQLQDVRVRLDAPVSANDPQWSGDFDLESLVAARMMGLRVSLRLRLADGREGWCRVTDVDFRPGALSPFAGVGTLSVATPPAA